MRVFYDSVIVIYLIEQDPLFAASVLVALDQLGPHTIISSELVRMETLVIPIRNGDFNRVRSFEDFFAQQVAEFVPLDRAVMDQAIQFRAARKGYRSPDALCLASALVSGCDCFVTNDHRLRNFPNMRIVSI